MQRLDARRVAAIDLAHHDGATPAVVDDAGLEVVGAEIDEAADRACRADPIRDHELVEPVLRRDHAAVLGEMWGERCHRCGGVLSFDREQHGLELALEPLGGERRGRYPELGDWPGDPAAVAGEHRDVVGGPVDEQDVVAGADQIGADRAADRTGAPDDDRAGAHVQPSSSSSRVSATATRQSASTSSSGRS